MRIRNPAFNFYNMRLMCCWCAPCQYLGCGDVLPAEPLADDAALLHLEAPALPTSGIGITSSGIDITPSGIGITTPGIGSRAGIPTSSSCGTVIFRLINS
jgi:hypothetical protein